MNGSSRIFCLLLILGMVSNEAAQKVNHERFKRFLIYPQQAPTRFQFIGGIGIPADLTYESLVIGYVLKAMYYLPFNETVYRENPFFPEYPVENTLDERKISNTKEYDSPLRWAFYKFIVDRLDSYGYNGQECMLRAICEANALHFDRHHNIFGDLMNILLRPTASKDLSSDLTIDYFEAEKLGRRGIESCDIYNCEVSLLNLISSVLEH